MGAGKFQIPWASLLCPACDFGQIPSPELLPRLFCCVGQGSTRETEPVGAIYKEIAYKGLVDMVVGADEASLKSKDRLWLWYAGEISSAPALPLRPFSRLTSWP